MKQFILIILSVFLTSSTLLAQDFWERLPFPEQTQLFSIAVKDSNIIFAGVHYTNDNNGVLRSMNFGQSWDKVLSPTGAILSMEIAANGRIYAGANKGGNLFYSDDSGDNWDSISIECRDNIVDIYCKGSDTVYMSKWSSYGSLLFRSNDAGATWDTVFIDFNSSEYVSDVLCTSNGTTYISTLGFFDDMGGVYRSTDNDSTWTLIGLFNCMVTCLATNSQGDLFAGSWGGVDIGNAGLYVMRYNSQDWVKIAGAQIADVLVNSDDHIYFGSGLPAGVYYSPNGGISFYRKSDGLGGGGVDQLEIDKKGFIYANDGNFNRTLSTTVSNENILTDKLQNKILVYPNPAISYINYKVLRNNIENAQLNVTDFYGKIVITNQNINLNVVNSINIDVLATGIYLIAVHADDKIYSSRFVKQ